ncbi:MAG TPA: DUF1552 domain-containing protein [Bryobacteraceae bacterium]|nr:DUF1552 domain-containing protein [Bryobacteraceae bacterium]
MQLTKPLSRRTILRGFGAAVSLPVLDAMIPAFASTPASTTPLRLAFVYVPNGIVMEQWTPAVAGADFDLTRILAPLAPHRANVLVLSGLAQNNGNPLGDGGGDHARASAVYLTGVHPKKTDGAGICAGISVDQVAAMQAGNATRFPSIELACEDGRMVGACDTGYSCAYSNTLSWRTPAMPLPPEVNPRAVFERLFGARDENPVDRGRRLRNETSILDYVLADARRLNARLSPNDRGKIDEYLTSVREIERRIQIAENQAQAAPSIEKPSGIPADFGDYSQLMFDLLTAAFQAGATRVGTVLLGREGSTRAYREIGISDAHHPITHHGGNPELIEKVVRINTYHVEQFAGFLGKLKSTADGDGTLLDHSLIVYGSGLSDGNRHEHDNLPVLLAGKSGGRHIAYPAETPMNNLHLALLDRMGVRIDSLGDSNGELKVLSLLDA